MDCSVYYTHCFSTDSISNCGNNGNSNVSIADQVAEYAFEAQVCCRTASREQAILCQVRGGP